MSARAWKAFAPAACIIILHACGDGSLRLASHRFGQSVSRDGAITDRSTVFAFPAYRRGGACRDLFNYLYFKGDTLCFSFTFSRVVGNRTVTAHFINPATGNRFPAERLEVRGGTVWGFSLVGSLLEKFNAGKLDDAVPAGAFCCAEIPFGVEVNIPGNGGDGITARKDASFRIEYR